MPTGRSAVVFDGDDTLWLSEPLYDQARLEAAAVVERVGLDPQRWEDLQKQIDVLNVDVVGLSSRRFPISCVVAYREHSGEAGFSADPLIEQELWQVANRVFTSRAPLAECARELLEELSAHCSLALLTQGEAWVQIKRIRDSGLERYFSASSIVPSKNAAAFRSVLSMIGAAADSSWSVGNSLPSDINPALELGMSAIWVESHVWEHERRTKQPVLGSVVAVGSLCEAKAVLMDNVACETQAGSQVAATGPGG